MAKKKPEIKFKDLTRPEEMRKFLASIKRVRIPTMEELERKRREKEKKAEASRFQREAKEAGFTDAQIKFLKKWFSRSGHKHPLPIELQRF